MNKIACLLIGVVWLSSLSWCANARSADTPQISQMEFQLSQLRGTIQNIEAQQRTLQSRIATETGPAMFLFGIFCAWWAQNTGRNAWLWFFLGLLFSVITGVVLLFKNSQDRQRFSANT